MSPSADQRYSAGEQFLGYVYQSRLALLKVLQLSEEYSILIEKDDDIDFQDNDGVKTLSSLKHKAIGERLTNLSLDFWKSVRIWLDRYNRDGRSSCTLKFFMFSTSEVSGDSFLINFFPTANCDLSQLLVSIESSLAESKSDKIIQIKINFDKLDEKEKIDFLSRIVLFDKSPRITAIPQIIIDNHMRTVRRQFRLAIFERLEGWWSGVVIDLLSGVRKSEIFGYEVSDKLAAIADEYKPDNLPIEFRNEKPSEKIDIENDPRLFVIQLRQLGLTTNRIQNAILDYYRAFQQRSSWARENILIGGEIEDYEGRLISEWERYRDIVFEKLDNECGEDILINAGKELYNWAEMNTSHIRIRERVSEPYVVRGNFQILANERPIPQIYWHPRFLERLSMVLSGSTK